MALVKGKFVDKDIPIQSNNDPVDLKDLARKGYVDQKAADEAAAAAADKVSKAGDTMTGDLVIQDGKLRIDHIVDGNTLQFDPNVSELLIKQDVVAPGLTSGMYPGQIVVSQLNEEGTESLAFTSIEPGLINLLGPGSMPAVPTADSNAVNKKYVDDSLASIDLSGKADLVDGKVPSSQLPGYVDDVEEYADLVSFPPEGSAGKLYVAQDTNKVYRWSGTVYIEISASPGSTDAVPEGSVNLYFTDERAQAALATALSGKSDVGHTHVAADITDFASAAEAALADELAGKQASLGTGTTSQYLRGDLTWQTISTSAPMAQIKHVAKSGVDASADGSQEKPYLTIAAAMASITDATPSKRYVIKIAAGAYSEAVSIKANVFLVGESKESVRITGAVSMNADFNQASSQDCRSGASMVTFLSAADFNWQTVTSPAGKLYFNEVVFGSTLAMYGHNNAIAQAQMNACIVFGNMTVSGINLGVATNNIFYGNVTLNQHPNGGMATIFAATGGSIGGTLRLNTTVNDFGKRCSAFLKSCYVENLIIDGAVSYVDCDLDSQGKSSTQKLNGGQLIALTSRINHDLETQMLKPLANNAHNLGDWGKQWMFHFAYVHASAGTDMYLLSAMENYDPAGDSAGRSIFIQPDAYGLQANVSGGNIELETATVSGTGVRGKVKVKARELDMTSAKITNLADGTDPQDAVSKAQLDAAIGGLPGGLSGKKETFTLSAGDIANAYIDCAHLAATDTMLVMSGGVVHVEGESYTLSTVGGVTRITFIGDLVDPSPSKLEAGDKVHIQYLK